MKIRKQTFSLDQYLKQMKVETIRTDQECQRMSGQWSANMVNELIFTVLTDNYIPPVILGEEIMGEIVKEYIIDYPYLEKYIDSLKTETNPSKIVKIVHEILSSLLE